MNWDSCLLSLKSGQDMAAFTSSFEDFNTIQRLSWNIWTIWRTFTWLSRLWRESAGGRTDIQLRRSGERAWLGRLRFLKLPKSSYLGFLFDIHTTIVIKIVYNMWTVHTLNETVDREFYQLPSEMRARFLWIADLIVQHQNCLPEDEVDRL